MRYILPLATLLLATPVCAAEPPATDPNRCLDLAAKMDASEAGKQQATKQEQHAYDDCIVHYNCSKVVPSETPQGTYDTSVSQMRYMIKVCGDQK